MPVCDHVFLKINQTLTRVQVGGFKLLGDPSEAVWFQNVVKKKKKEVVTLEVLFHIQNESIMKENFHKAKHLNDKRRTTRNQGS